MDFWLNCISKSFQFSFSSHLYYQLFLKLFWLLFHQLLPYTGYFHWCHHFRFHILIRQSMFIQYFNFSILVYIPTTISLWNCMPHFKNIVSPVFLLAHVGQLLLTISITDLYEYCIFFEYLCYKVLIFCLCRSFGGNSLLIWTTLPYNPKYAIQGVFE